MTRPNITLVHSSEPSVAAETGHEEWVFENARQLNLFDDSKETLFLITAIGELCAHSFRKILSEYHPNAIIDTRAFPDFFRIFETTSIALATLKSEGINYLRAPINVRDSGDELREQLSQFQSLVDQWNAEHRTKAPIVILVSTRKNLGKLRARLEGYVENNIPNASFMEA